MEGGGRGEEDATEGAQKKSLEKLQKKTGREEKSAQPENL